MFSSSRNAEKLEVNQLDILICKKKVALKKGRKRKLTKKRKKLPKLFRRGKNVGNQKRIFIFFYFFFGKIENPTPFFLHIQGAGGN